MPNVASLLAAHPPLALRARRANRVGTDPGCEGWNDVETART